MAQHPLLNTKEEPLSEKELSQQDADYLRMLTDCEHGAIDQFDKTVLTLAGGAFAVSFAFLKDIVKPEQVTHKCLLICAWTFWSISLLCTLTSFYFSHIAMRHAQRKFRDGVRREKSLRGWFGTATIWLNPASGVAFMVGLISMSAFVTTNLNYANNSSCSTNAPTQAPTSSSATPSTNAPSAAPTGTRAAFPAHPANSKSP
jgi:hypothetical protein